MDWIKLVLEVIKEVLGLAKPKDSPTPDLTKMQPPPAAPAPGQKKG